MPFILCHSPKGGSGTSFIAAQIAIGLSVRGVAVAALSIGATPSLNLHFGLAPGHPLPALVEEVELYWSGADEHATLVDRLDTLAARRTVVVDLAAPAAALAHVLAARATLRIAALSPSPSCVAQLHELAAGDGVHYVVNALDETHRIARHCHALLREMLGDRVLARVRRDGAVDEAQAMLQPLALYAPDSALIADLSDLTEAVVTWLTKSAAKRHAA
jgi:chromosome partitioning protein